MMISFWAAFFLFTAGGILIWILCGFITKKVNGNFAIGGIIGFFLAIGFVLLMMFMPGRLYVVTGNEEFSDFLVFGEQQYKLKDGSEITVKIEGEHCMVINDWDKPVIVEHVQYGGVVNFGNETSWVEPKKSKLIEGNRIFYFFKEGPPDEISTKSDEDKLFRLWLRNKRE